MRGRKQRIGILLAGALVCAQGQWLNYPAPGIPRTRDGKANLSALRIQERFRHRDFGHMDVQATIDDPKTYTKPFTIKFTELLMRDSDILESFCNENEKDRPHLPSQ